MKLNQDGYIYYLVRKESHFMIKEINPNADHLHQHLIIAEIKSENCFGFTILGSEFYFIDDSKTVIKLIRQSESRMLSEDSLYRMKDKDRPHFKKKHVFSSVFVCDKYII